MSARCPDCSGVEVDRHLNHDKTCPLGLSIDAVSDEDRDWFAAHPWATARHRRLTVAERIDFRMHGYWEADHWTHVQVIQVQPGVRARHPYGGGLMAPYSDEQVERIRVRFGVNSGAS